MSNSLWPHDLQHTKLLCPSLSPGVCSDSCPLSCGPSTNGWENQTKLKLCSLSSSPTTHTGTSLLALLRVCTRYHCTPWVRPPFSVFFLTFFLLTPSFLLLLLFNVNPSLGASRSRRTAKPGCQRTQILSGIACLCHLSALWAWKNHLLFLSVCFIVGVSPIP